MPKFTVLAAVLVSGLAFSSAHAAGSAPIAWVSKQSGSDVASCGGLAGPCKTLQYAVDNIVAVKGTIMLRDAGAFGSLAISHSVSIINESGAPVILSAASGDAVTIHAGANDAITLKGLILDGAGTGANGIHLISGGNLVVDGCTVKGFGADGSGNGIFVHPTPGKTTVLVSGSTISENAGTGIGLASSLVPQSTLKAIVQDSVLTKNGTGLDPSGATTNVIVKNVTATFNKTGVRIGNQAKLAMTRSVVIDNTQFDVVISNGSTADFKSFGDNVVFNTTKLQ
jgi:hypothetical protein